MPAEKRSADFAGTWYPGSSQECTREIEEFLKSAKPPVSKDRLVGGIVPHAGWIFSGRVACTVFHILAKNSSGIEAIVIFGGHLAPDSPNTIMKHGSWDTPFGELPIASSWAEEISKHFEFIEETTTRYQRDNTIELQLPFIKYFFPDVKILPVTAAPREESLDIGEKLAEMAEQQGIPTLFIGSTDLTHYGPNYGFIPKGTGDRALRWVTECNDKKMVDLMKEMNAQGILHEAERNQNACCAGAVATAVTAAKRLGVQKGTAAVYATSRDVIPESSFVGYVGVVF